MPHLPRVSQSLLAACTCGCPFTMSQASRLLRVPPMLPVVPVVPVRQTASRPLQKMKTPEGCQRQWCCMPRRCLEARSRPVLVPPCAICESTTQQDRICGTTTVLIVGLVLYVCCHCRASATINTVVLRCIRRGVYFGA